MADGRKETVFREFNSLSVVYAMPEVEFLDAEHRFVSPADVAADVFAAAPVGVPAAPAPAAAAAAPSAHAFADPFLSPPPAPVTAPVAVSRSAPEVDLLGLDSFLAPAPVAVAPAPRWSLLPNPHLEPAEFQAKWGSLAAGCVPLPPCVAAWVGRCCLVMLSYRLVSCRGAFGCLVLPGREMACRGDNS